MTVAVSSGTTTAATVNKTSLSFTTTNWNTDQTVTVTGVDDSIDNNPDRTATVGHRASGGDYGSVSKDLTVTVTDDEGTASLSVANASVTEGDTGEADLRLPCHAVAGGGSCGDGGLGDQQGDGRHGGCRAPTTPPAAAR